MPTLIDSDLLLLLLLCAQDGRSNIFLAPGEFSMEGVTRVLDAAEAAIGSRDLLSFKSLTQPLRQIAAKYSNGVIGANRDGLCDLLKQFLAVESLFGGGGKERRFEDVIFDLRQSGARSVCLCICVLCRRVIPR